MNFLNYSGANGSGKSTRVYYLYRYLDSKFEQQPVYFPCRDKSRGGAPKQRCGVLFENGWLLFGRLCGNKSAWVSWDSGLLSTHLSRFEFFNSVASYNGFDYPVHWIVGEGYFNNVGAGALPGSIRSVLIGLERYELLVSYYDQVKEFGTRLEKRTGKKRTKAELERSPGWSMNGSMKKLFAEASSQAVPPDIVQRVSIEAPEDYLVQRYFEERFELPPEPQKLGFL